ncbi:MAG: response regulator [Lachnospiraceae bacterium]|nr:response regulator [Lachnospiraceae bacterium]
MYQFVISVLYFTIAGLFAVCWFALKKWKSRLHTYLFFFCVSNLVYDTGCLLELRSINQETYVTALKMAYLGRIWIGLSLFLFLVELCYIFIPGYLITAAAVIHVIIYATILDIERNDLYYNYMEFAMEGDFPKLLHSGGPLYYLLTALNLFYTVGGVFLITRKFIREKSEIAKKRYFLITIAIFAVGGTYVIYFFKLIPLARKFDVTVIGFAVCVVLLLVAIIKFGMLDATAAAKNYVVDELSEAVITVDSEGKITFFNKPAEKLFPELGDKLMGDDPDPELLKDVCDILESGEPLKLNGKIYTPKANRLTEDEKNVGTLYTLTDDSEHYRYMDELRAQMQIADEANEAKSQFLANMSHEIRTPINAVLGFNEMILRECKGAKDPEEETDSDTAISNIGSYAVNIKNAGSNLLSIINGILDISKIEAGRMDIVDAPYALSSLLNDVSNMVFFKAKEKGLEFTVDVDENLPDELCGDKARIRQVITNILANAVKYTDKGSVRLTVRGQEDMKIEPGQLLNLKIEVKDTGIGMKEEDIDKLFTKFQRLDLTHNSTIEGTGLGLAISRQLMNMMGGNIKVESKYGEGSTFVMELPQKIVSIEPVGDFKTRFEKDLKEAKSSEEVFMAPDAHILVVDDTRVNLTVARGLLKNTGIRIDTAASGSEAIEKTLKETYDLILMDQRMPGMDGTQALKVIRDQEKGKNLDTPVICLTADAIIGAKERYIAEGFSDYLAKPINNHELLQIMTMHLPQDKIIR